MASTIIKRWVAMGNRVQGNRVCLFNVFPLILSLILLSPAQVSECSPLTIAKDMMFRFLPVPNVNQQNDSISFTFRAFDNSSSADSFCMMPSNDSKLLPQTIFL